jgi:two-component system sensor histidine kinase FlrB
MIYASHLAEQALNVETQQRFAGRLKERLHELEHQVRDMLVFARGELPMTDRVTPTGLVAALESAAQTHLQGVAVRWQCDSPAGELLCNRDTLVGALLNLIENAVQASAGCARIKIHAYRRGNTLRLCVSDSGSGIEPAALARMGEPFFTTKATGTGLGLAVVTAVTRAHQGSIEFRSRPGRGTCAIVSLPLIPGTGALPMSSGDLS